ncbi:hypothetical protein GCM10023339_22780 [Alloalcanivorax gelatiniphagus]
MSLPTDFHHEVADRVEQPGFAVVLDRARAARRRRRTTLSTGLAAACVVGGLATWGAGWRAGDGAEPAGPSPAPLPTELTGEVDERLPADVRDVLGSDRLHPWQVVGSGGGTAAVWGDCEDGCRFALVTRLGDDVRGRVLEGDSPTITEVPGGWLVDDGSGLFRVSPGGEREEVVDPGGNPVPAEAGDVVVPTADGPRLLRGDKLLPVPTPDGGEPLAAYATPAGDLVVASRSGTGDVQVSWTEDGGGAWSPGLLPRPGAGPVSAVVMAGHHDGVAVALLGDAPDGSIPVLEVASSQDVGRTWSPARGVGGLRDLSGLAVSDEGSTYVTTGSHGAVRFDAGGDALPVGQPGDHSVFLVAHRVCFVTEVGRVDELRCSPDDGATWVPQPLPGFG